MRTQDKTPVGLCELVHPSLGAISYISQYAIFLANDGRGDPFVQKIANANIQKEAWKTNLQSCTCFFLRVKITPAPPFETVHNFLARGLLVNRLNLSYLIVCPRFFARSGLHALTEILEKASIHSQC